MMKHDYHLSSHHLNGLGCEEVTGAESWKNLEVSLFLFCNHYIHPKRERNRAVDMFLRKMKANWDTKSANRQLFFGFLFFSFPFLFEMEYLRGNG